MLFPPSLCDAVLCCLVVCVQAALRRFAADAVGASSDLSSTTPSPTPTLPATATATTTAGGISHYHSQPLNTREHQWKRQRQQPQPPPPLPTHLTPPDTRPATPGAVAAAVEADEKDEMGLGRWQTVPQREQTSSSHVQATAERDSAACLLPPSLQHKLHSADRCTDQPYREQQQQQQQHTPHASHTALSPASYSATLASVSPSPLVAPHSLLPAPATSADARAGLFRKRKAKESAEDDIQPAIQI